MKNLKCHETVCRNFLEIDLTKIVQRKDQFMKMNLFKNLWFGAGNVGICMCRIVAIRVFDEFQSIRREIKFYVVEKKSYKNW